MSVDINTLLAEREITRSISQFARAMDARDWDELHRIMTPDATAELGTGTLSGPAEVVTAIRSFLDECGPTQHLIGNVLVDVDGDRATSRAYVSDMHLGTGSKAHLNFATLGDYHDSWARVDGTWRMTHRTKHSHGIRGSIEVLGAGPSGWRR
ncbi:nuclear transport factor 2 family protein [Rhodococcus sp. OK302]|uniref:nuclear transport factor 2 family protein n=1 Tax=Rhodococcus sp. OK302 TaxID=1882769 RepID=UPI000B93B845|nr:nuclear transport factor 2 family protein [Rhodococcus sp. OK302]OYD66876.1 SnoaL-like protein [Rhodococcus sp. OK302]